jgi:endoglucanase
MIVESAPSKKYLGPHDRLLRRLTEASGVSGNEQAIREIVRENIESYVDEIHVDSMGNLLAVKRGTSRRRMKVMLAAHMDEIGFLVVGIDKDGLLRFDKVGGIDPRHLPGKVVWVGEKQIPGVIGAKPIHLTKAEERAKAPEVEGLRIDIGATSKDSALARVQPGDQVTFATRFSRSGPTLRGKALDDRLGVAALIEILQFPRTSVDLQAAFTVQEEVGLRGARIAAFALDPDVAIALDCTPAYDLPTWEEKSHTRYNTRAGEGPAIYVADRATLGNPGLIQWLTLTAQQEAIPFQYRQPGGGGTDAGSIHLSREGIPSVSLSVPARNLHSTVSLARTLDWRHQIRLIHHGLNNLRPSTLHLG